MSNLSSNLVFSNLLVWMNGTGKVIGKKPTIKMARRKKKSIKFHLDNSNAFLFFFFYLNYLLHFYSNFFVFRKKIIYFRSKSPKLPKVFIIFPGIENDNFIFRFYRELPDDISYLCTFLSSSSSSSLIFKRIKYFIIANVFIIISFYFTHRIVF